MNKHGKEGSNMRDKEAKKNIREKRRNIDKIGEGRIKRELLGAPMRNLSQKFEN